VSFFKFLDDQFVDLLYITDMTCIWRKSGTSKIISGALYIYF